MPGSQRMLSGPKMAVLLTTATLGRLCSGQLRLLYAGGGGGQLPWVGLQLESCLSSLPPKVAELSGAGSGR